MFRVLTWRWLANDPRQSASLFPGRFYADLACGCRVHVPWSLKAQDPQMLPCVGDHRPHVEF